VNPATAGRTIPVRFRLGGDFGLGILGGGTRVSGGTDCDSGAPVELVEETGARTFWGRRRGAWAGSCRQLVVRFADGTTQTALFRLG